VALKRYLDPHVQFEANYTLSFDKSDDDNERDPFTLRYANLDSLKNEYNWSDRDQRHRFNAWVLTDVHGFAINNLIHVYSAQPRSLKCGANNQATDTTAASAAQRICPDGHILLRNTGRKDNTYISWDVRISKSLPVGRPGQQLEILAEVFNLTGADNFRDPSFATYLNFDGTLRSGLGDPRQLQVGARWQF
jgi:hypothetical protein